MRSRAVKIKTGAACLLCRNSPQDFETIAVRQSEVEHDCVVRDYFRCVKCRRRGWERIDAKSMPGQAFELSTRPIGNDPQ